MTSMRDLINLVEMPIIQRQGDLAPVLWHGTDVLAMASILASNRMTNSIDTDGRPGGAHGVSLTSNPAVASYFAARSVEIWMVNHGHDFQQDSGSPLAKEMPSLDGGVIEFDARKLAQRYQIVRYDDDDLEEEDEERVLTKDGIKPVLPFIRCFYAKLTEIEFFLRYLADPAQREYERTDGIIAALETMKRHPLRKEP